MNFGPSNSPRRLVAIVGVVALIGVALQAVAVFLPEPGFPVELTLEDVLDEATGVTRAIALDSGREARMSIDGNRITLPDGRTMDLPERVKGIAQTESGAGVVDGPFAVRFSGEGHVVPRAKGDAIGVVAGGRHLLLVPLTGKVVRHAE